MKSEYFRQWLPGIISELVAIITCVVYALMGGDKLTIYLELLGTGLVPFLFTIYGLISKEPLPIILSVISGIFVFCSCGLGSAFGFYDLIPCWDLLLHGSFGFICSLVVFLLLLRWNGESLKPFGFLAVVFVFTLGVASVWEIWEYIADSITGGDAQRVMESIALGKSPIADTMEDIIITIVGSAVFIVTFIIDKFRGYKFYSKFCGFKGFDKRDA